MYEYLHEVSDSITREMTGFLTSSSGIIRIASIGGGPGCCLLAVKEFTSRVFPDKNIIATVVDQWVQILFTRGILS